MAFVVFGNEPRYVFPEAFALILVVADKGAAMLDRCFDANSIEADVVQFIMMEAVIGDRSPNGYGPTESIAACRYGGICRDFCCCCDSFGISGSSSAEIGLTVARKASSNMALPIPLRAFCSANAFHVAP